MAPDAPPPRPADLFDLTGQVALVTGASRGLGWAMAQVLAAAGAHVVLNARDAAAVTARAEQLRGWGLSGEGMAFDVADPQAPVAALADIAARHGRLDILVSNAAGSVRKPLVDQTEADWQSVLDVGLTAGWRLARAAAPGMIAAGYGRMIFVSSIMAAVVRPEVSAYAAVKAGIEGFVRSLALELAPFGITANVIAPGYFTTDGNSALRAERPEFEGWIARRTPAARWGRPPELGTVALYLASPASGYTTGAVHRVDGGLTVAI